MKITVLGAGSWGTALAQVYSLNGYETILWARNPQTSYEITKHNTNKHYLGNTKLSNLFNVTSDLALAIYQADLITVAVPSQAIPSVIKQISPFIEKCSILAHAVKGFDSVTNQRISQLLIDAFPKLQNQICVISGPSHAEEVVAGLPTTLVVSGFRQDLTETLQFALMNPQLRVYTNPDIVGVELGGALKNIIALGVGIGVGLGFGDNAKAALMTRGLAEIVRLGISMGASPLTFAGLSGIGDLIVTCTSRHSRNFRAGHLIAQGLSIPQVTKQIGMAIEGIHATKSALQLAKEFNIEMPITQAIYSILFENKPAHVAVRDLMDRERNHEIEEVAKQAMSPKWMVPSISN